jgi:hypothetical protein
MKERNFLWSEEALEQLIQLEKYKVIVMWMKLGLNVFDLETIARNSEKGSFEEAVYDLFRIKAIVSQEVYNVLKRENPVVWVRIRDIDSKTEKKELKKFKDYLKLLEERAFEFPDVHWWPYNFETPEQFHQYVKKKLETGSYISSNKFSLNS